MIAQMITISRRHALHLLGATATITVAPNGFATVDAVAGRLAKLLMEASIGDLEIFLDMPEIAENGNQVKISFEIDSPMTADDHVIYVFADGNPEPSVAQFNFTPTMGACGATTNAFVKNTKCYGASCIEQWHFCKG